MSEHQPNGCCDYHRHIADGCCHCETSVPPTQPPAAPETDVRLTEAERTDLAVAVHDTDAAVCSCEAVYAAVERIVAERVRVVEGERDEALASIEGWADDAQGWKSDALAMKARAESAEAAHEALRAAVEALRLNLNADADYRVTKGSIGHRLRALLAGGEER